MCSNILPPPHLFKWLIIFALRISAIFMDDNTLEWVCMLDHWPGYNRVNSLTNVWGRWMVHYQLYSYLVSILFQN